MLQFGKHILKGAQIFPNFSNGTKIKRTSADSTITALFRKEKERPELIYDVPGTGN
jgi:hypothetical protein